MCSRWIDGTYKLVLNETRLMGTCVVDGREVTNYGRTFNDEKGTMFWEVGQFGEADARVQKLTGRKYNDIKISSPNHKEIWGVDSSFGVVREDCKTVTLLCLGSLAQYVWITQEEVEEMKNNSEPADCPPCHYKIQPQNIGKFIWISGPPGTGKSTTSKRLMEKEGFVYYEGDCFMINLNPFIPPFEGETIDAMLKQRELRGISKERSNITSKVRVAYRDLVKNKDDEEAIEIMNKIYSLMSEDIDEQRRRIGGDWVVCQAVPRESHRDLIRSKLGPDLVFVVLDLDKEAGLERLKMRKDFDEEVINTWIKMGQMFETATENEDNTIDLKVAKDMSLADVVKNILDNPLLI